jgi:predicted secreted hydrolase
MAEKESLEIIEEYNAEIAINTERNRIRLEAENQANRELYYGIAKAQSDVIATAIDNWKKKELEKVTKDPSSYIKIN